MSVYNVGCLRVECLAIVIRNFSAAIFSFDAFYFLLMNKFMSDCQVLIKVYNRGENKNDVGVMYVISSALRTKILTKNGIKKY